MNTFIPQKFRERYRIIVDDEEAFYDSLQKFLPRCFRVNTIKARKETVLRKFLKYGIAFEHVPWMSNAFLVDDVSANKTIEHFLGHIYIQEAVSMLPATLIPKRLLGPDAKVLDACAAPGSK